MTSGYRTSCGKAGRVGGAGGTSVALPEAGYARNDADTVTWNVWASPAAPVTVLMRHLPMLSRRETHDGPACAYVSVP